MTPDIAPAGPRPPHGRVTFRQDFRRAFLNGMGALLPTILTLLILVKVLEFVDLYIGRFIRTGLLFGVFCAAGPTQIADHLGIRPDTPAAEVYKAFIQAYGSQWYLVILSFLVAVSLVYFIGVFLASMVGRGVYRLLEGGFRRLPGVRSVYPYVKQITDTLFTTRTIRDFNRVVAVEYPRKGVYSLGLVVSSGMRVLNEVTGSEHVCVFIPSSPTPLTGYAILVRIEEIVDLPISMDQLFRFLMSGGVIIPPDQLVVLAGAKGPVRLPAKTEPEPSGASAEVSERAGGKGV